MSIVSARQARPLVILGPTASGKSSLALGVAAELGNVELVSVDSMQVYRGMDIGTATPTQAEQAIVAHHLINIVDPSTPFTVGEFQARAKLAIAQITERGNIPVLVGGTGLYLRSLVDNLEFPGQFPNVARDLDAEPDTEALHRRLGELDPLGASRMEPTNRRRILRALEVTIGSGQPFSSFGPGMESYPATPFVQVALRWPRDTLNQRIADRYQEQMERGFLNEVRWLKQVGPSVTAAQALGYRELLTHLDGQCTLEEAIATAVSRTRRFARRQERWFRRDPRVQWVDGPADVMEVVQIWDRIVRTPPN